MSDPNNAPDPSGTVQVNNVPPNDPNAYTPPAIDMAVALPPDLREKPAFKGKDFLALVKDHDNLQTLLGQRPAGIPKEDAPPEEWDKFLGAIKPKSGDEYELPETEYSKTKGRNDDYVKAIKELFYGADISKRQGTKLLSGIEGFLSKAAEVTDAQAAEKTKARELEFEGMLDKTFKDQKQTVIDRTKKLMLESVDPTQKELVGKVLKDISNENLFALTIVLDSVYKKHIAEDTPPGPGDGATGDVLGWKTEAEKIMNSDVYKDFRKPGYDEARAKVTELFNRISAATSK